MVKLKDLKFNALVSTVLNEPNVVAGCAPKTPLIDAAGPGRKVYQVTVADKHEMALDATEKLFKALGFIDGKKSVADNAVEKLEFYWVVPTEIATKWRSKLAFRYPVASDEKKVVKEGQKLANDRNKLLNECLEKHGFDAGRTTNVFRLENKEDKTRPRTVVLRVTDKFSSDIQFFHLVIVLQDK
jgi:hypothetical protein